MQRALKIVTLFLILFFCNKSKAEINIFDGRLNIAGFAELTITTGQPKNFRLEDPNIPKHFFIGRIASAWKYVDLALSISHGTECRKTGAIKLDSEVCIQEAKLTAKFPRNFAVTAGSDLAPFGITTIGISRTGNVASTLPITSLTSPYTTFGGYLQHTPSEFFSWLAGVTTWNGYLPYGENSPLAYYAGATIKPWYRGGDKESVVNMFFAAMPSSMMYGRLFFGDISLSLYKGPVIALVETHFGSAHDERLSWVSMSALLGIKLPKLFGILHPVAFVGAEGYGHQNPHELASPTGMNIPKTMAEQIGVKIQIIPSNSPIQFNIASTCTFENRDSFWCKIQTGLSF